MTGLRYIARSLAHYRRTHLGVLLGAALAAAILTGALAVGDSVRHSLARIAQARIGSVSTALVASEHFFSEQLATELAAALQVPAAPLLLLRGTVATPDGSARANDIQVVGADARFWSLGSAQPPAAQDGGDSLALNTRLAEQLGVKPGDTVIVRVETPAPLSRDAPLSGTANSTLALRARVAAVVGDEQFGRFSLRAEQVSPLTVFVPLGELQRQLNQAGRANVVLLGGGASLAPQRAAAALRQTWTLDDAQLEFQPLPEAGGFALRTPAVFLDRRVETAAREAHPGARGVLTYLVNEIRKGDKSTPYSMVTATDDLPFPGLRPDEILINAWLAEDLEAKPGDELALSYFVMEGRRNLVEQTRRFRVRAIVPLEGPDLSWTPEFPGVSSVGSCRDWTPGLPVETKRIRPKDEAYWKTHHGTPKAFLTLAAGQELWSNRFGRLTSLRIPGLGAGGAMPSGHLRAALVPEQVGLVLRPVQASAQLAGQEGQDFGGLFIGFSFFLIAASLLLMSLLFVFHLEQRAGERALLLALGFTPRRVGLLLWAEASIVAAVGTGVGVAAGVLYTQLALRGLSTLWHETTRVQHFVYHANASTLLGGAAAALLASLFATGWACRRQDPWALSVRIAGGQGIEPPPPARAGWLNRGGLAACLAGAAALVLTGAGAADAFFGAGALLLIAGLLGCRWGLIALAQAHKQAGSPVAVGLRGAARRLGRSLSTIAVLASGMFLVTSVGAFRQDASRGAEQRGSGTGGFALFARSTLPLYEDLNTPAGRAAWNLDAELLRGSAVVPVRVQPGDDASCLNLNRAQQPQLLGIDPGELQRRQAFTFTQTSPGVVRGDGWKELERAEPDGALPAVGDEATLTWALGKTVGDTLTLVDERGAPLRLRIVGVLANSILQGNLIIAERAFLARFPGSAGSRLLLIDCAAGRSEALAAHLMARLQDRGLEVVPAARRLAEFAAVENGYISIFQMLGGLGLLLGTAGFGIVTLRNLFERRSELALLLALGFSPGAIHRLIAAEHGLLLGLGLLVGGLAAGVAVLPSWLAAPAGTDLAWTLALWAGCAAVGALWSLFAARAALRGPLLDALRSE
jgi:ABC-type antimicrobial peptide transport system permease subunit